MNLSHLQRWLTMKNLLVALAFVTACLLMGHAAVVFAYEGGAIIEMVQVDMQPAEHEHIVGTPDPSTPPHAKTIRISLRNQMAYLMEYGNVVKTYRISSGAWETPTPRGNFQIHKKQPLRVSSQGVPYRMPNYMAFTPNEAFGLHALPYLGRSKESSWYWQEANDHIGTPVSHGCIRFLPEEAVEIYQWVDVGTKVFIRS